MADQDEGNLMHQAPDEITAPDAGQRYFIRTPLENQQFGVPLHRFHAQAGGFLDPWQTVILLQDILEAHILPKVRQDYTEWTAYYIQLGLVTDGDRLLQ